MSGPPGFYGINEADAAIRFVTAKGYPADWFIPLRHTGTIHAGGSGGHVLNELRRRGVHSFHAGDQQFSHARAPAASSSKPERERGGGPRTAGGRRSRRPITTRHAWWRTREGRKIAFLEWTKTVTSAVRDLSHVGMRCAPSANTCGDTARGLALGGVCLVVKDVAQALQPLMIRAAVDSFPRRRRVFVRYAGYLVGARR